MRIGNSSSKYDFQPHLIDVAINNKANIRGAKKEEFKNIIEQLLRSDIRYIDNLPMSVEVKWNILMEACRELMTEYGLN